MTIFRLKVKIVVQLTVKQKIVVQSTVKSNGKKSINSTASMFLTCWSCLQQAATQKKICKILMHHKTQNKSFLRSDG